MIGPPPPWNVVADWLPTPLFPMPLVPPTVCVPPPIPLVPLPVEPVPAGDPNPPGVLAPEIVEVPPIPEPPIAVPIPASGFPNNPFTVVLFSPAWMIRQSALPVIGSSYFRRRKRMLFVFSNWSTDVG